MSPIVADKCVFVRSGEPTTWDDASKVPSNGEINTDGSQLTVATYVDELTITGTKEQTQWLMAKLRDIFELQESETGDIDFILSMGVIRDRSKRTLTLNQSLAIEKIANGLGITEVKPSIKTPMKSSHMEKLKEPDPKCTSV